MTRDGREHWVLDPLIDDYWLLTLALAPIIPLVAGGSSW